MAGSFFAFGDKPDGARETLDYVDWVRRGAVTKETEDPAPPTDAHRQLRRITNRVDGVGRTRCTTRLRGGNTAESSCVCAWLGRDGPCQGATQHTTGSIASIRNAESTPTSLHRRQRIDCWFDLTSIARSSRETCLAGPLLFECSRAVSPGAGGLPDPGAQKRGRSTERSRAPGAASSCRGLHCGMA